MAESRKSPAHPGPIATKSTAAVKKAAKAPAKKISPAKATTKKAPTKATTKKAPTKAAPVKAPAKKTPAKAQAAKATAPKKAPAKTTATAKKAPIKAAVPAKKTPAKATAKATTKKAPTKAAPVKAVAKKTPAKKAAARTTKRSGPRTPSTVTGPSTKVTALGTPALPDSVSPALTSHADALLDAIIEPSPKRGAASTPVADAVKKAETEPLTSDEWNDKNRELFFTRIRLTEEIEKIEAVAPDDRTVRMTRQLARLRRDLDDVTFKIFDTNYGLLRRYVRRFTQNASKDDAREFTGAATVGMMRAIATYDPAKGRFAQWAFKPMQREVLRAVWATDHQNMNSGDFERRPDILKAQRKLQDGDDTVQPPIELVAAEAGVTVEQAKRVLRAPRLESLATPVGDGQATVGDIIIDSSSTSVEDEVLAKMSIKDLETYGLADLDPRELFVIIRRQGLDCEPKQRLNSIGVTLGLSREAVRQIESKARGKLAHPVVLRKLARQGRA